MTSKDGFTGGQEEPFGGDLGGRCWREAKKYLENRENSKIQSIGLVEADPRMVDTSLCDGEGDECSDTLSLGCL